MTGNTRPFFLLGAQRWQDKAAYAIVSHWQAERNTS